MTRGESDRGRGFGLGLCAGLVLAGVQIGLVRALEFVPAGTRAQGAGVALTTALILLFGYALGARRRIPGGWGWTSPPRSPVIGLAVGLLCAGTLGGFGLLDALFGTVGVGEGGMARGMLATNRVGFPALVLGALGAALGINARPRSTLFGLGGALTLVGLGLVARELARWYWGDPDAIGVVTTVGVGFAALGVGFVLAWLRRGLAFVEMALAALLSGYALYLSVAIGPEALVRSWSLPIEQILLALSLVPTVGLMALLAVGGSLGFILFGGGQFDPGFGFEMGVARRYMQVNLRSAKARVAMGVFFILSCVGAVMAGAWALKARGHVWAVGVAAGALLPWLATFGYRMWRRRRQKGRRRESPFVGVVTVISVIGVALGVIALIVVLSVMSGFEEDLKRKILGAHAHVVIEKYGDDFEEFEEVEARAREVGGVETAAAFVLGDAMMSTDSGLSGVLVKGIDPESPDAVRELAKNIERGRIEFLAEPKGIPGACGQRALHPPPLPPSTRTATRADGLAIAPPRSLNTLALNDSANCPGRVLPGVIIGKELSRTLRAYVGDVVKLVSPISEDIGPLGPTPKLRRFRVAGVFFSGMYEYDAKLAYLAMPRAQRFFGKRGRASGVELMIVDADRSGAMKAELERRLGGEPYRVKDWRDMNKELFSALLLEKIAMFVALTMIIAVASFLIVATLVMIVLQRGREIAILKSVGANEASIMKIFVIQGVIVGVGGAVLGILAGVGICLLLETVGLPLDERIFYIEKLPVALDWTEVGIIAGSAMIITYLATIYPAMTAAVLHPVDGLREE